MASKLYGDNATIIIFVFVFFFIVVIWCGVVMLCGAMVW